MRMHAAMLRCAGLMLHIKRSPGSIGAWLEARSAFQNVADHSTPFAPDGARRTCRHTA